MKLLAAILLILSPAFSHAQKLRVGAKHFNEGYILSEIISQLLESRGFEVERVYNLGGTMVCFEALRNSQIDIYPEYTGTLAAEILKKNERLDVLEIRQLLERDLNLSISEPYGFNNTYALVVRKELSLKSGITKVSDLRDRTGLTFGLSYEFLKRHDGWESLAKHYRLTHEVVGLEHGLAYEALRKKEIDVTDAYSTDGEIKLNDLMLLEDDLDFFPEYQAVSFYDNDLASSAKQILSVLTGSINEADMQSMNASVLYSDQTFEDVARAFLIRRNLVTDTGADRTPVYKQLWARTAEHIALTLISIIAAIVISVPTGIIVHWTPSVARLTLYITGLLQTIPSIALLAIMIPIFGIGMTPAIVALFLYALLPIVRNTVTGLNGIDPRLIEVADSLGMTRYQKLRMVEFPLSIPVILSGIRIATVIGIGTATLAAFIGAGGLGEFIVTGLALNDTSLILYGAIPAAALAILSEIVFEVVEKKLRRRAQ